MYFQLLSTLFGLIISSYVFHLSSATVGLGSVETVEDLKQMKRILKAHNNVLIVFGKSKKSAGKWDKILDEVSNQLIGQASIVKINCDSNKKTCKHFKVSPNPLAIHHYHDGKFNSEYNRKQTAKSLKSFLEDPTGEAPWEEEPTAKNVVHLTDYRSLVSLVQQSKLPILLMFYAPWCGYCKRLKPEYAMAADESNSAVLAAMNVDKEENMIVRQQFNITGYPTLVYIKDGSPEPYGGGFTKDSILTWLDNPQPPKEPEPEKDWSEETDDVTFLTDENFSTELAKSSSALVMFYAPWCGHCKAMKPAYQSVAKTIRESGINGMMAAVDATKHKKAAEQLKIKGFPTVKYFVNGQYKFDVNERSEEKLLEFMKDPKEPASQPADTPWSEEPSRVQHLNSENFANFVKKKRRTLVMFYAPWCGHCKRAKPEFTSAAERLAATTPKAALAAVDCTGSAELCKLHGVTGYPTILHFYFGKNPSPYTGQRLADDFVQFMTNDDKLEL